MNVDEKNERWQNLVGKKLEEAIEAVKADGMFTFLILF